MPGLSTSGLVGCGLGIGVVKRVMHKDKGTNLDNISKLLFGTTEERQAIQRINHERKYSEVLNQLVGIQPHIVENNFNCLTNNLLSVLRQYMINNMLILERWNGLKQKLQF